MAKHFLVVLGLLLAMSATFPNRTLQELGPTPTAPPPGSLVAKNGQEIVKPKTKSHHKKRNRRHRKKSANSKTFNETLKNFGFEKLLAKNHTKSAHSKSKKNNSNKKKKNSSIIEILKGLVGKKKSDPESHKGAEGNSTNQNLAANATKTHPASKHKPRRRRHTKKTKPEQKPTENVIAKNNATNTTILNPNNNLNSTKIPENSNTTKIPENLNSTNIAPNLADSAQKTAPSNSSIQNPGQFPKKPETAK
jgi:hypothetical protein